VIKHEHLIRLLQEINYKKALKVNKDLWINCDKKEWERLFDSTTIVPILPLNIPKEEKRNIAYYNRQIKEIVKVINDKEFIEARVRGTFGGNVIKYDGPVSSNTADYATVKLLFSSVLSDVKNKNSKVRFVSIDLVDYYLETPMEKPGYMAVLSTRYPRIL
jgi:hypothetical protein